MIKFSIFNVKNQETPLKTYQIEHIESLQLTVYKFYLKTLKIPLYLT